MQKKVLLNANQIDIIINRLVCQLIENHHDFSNTVLIGLQPRGIYLLEKLLNVLSEKHADKKITSGNLDYTFFRDDFRRKTGILTPHETNIDFNIENRDVVIIDDVLYTGRTIRSALDALGSFGRACSIELLVLIDRRFSREIPIESKYIGKSVDVFDTEYVLVNWEKNDKNKDSVILFNN